MMIANTRKIAEKAVLITGSGRPFMSKALTVRGVATKLSPCIVSTQDRTHFQITTDYRKFGDVNMRKYNALHSNNVGVLPSFNTTVCMFHTSTWCCDESKAGDSQIAGLFTTISKSLSSDLVDKTKAIYQFNVKGKEEGVWHLDLKNGSGACGQGEPPSAADATLTMDSKNFVDMFAGKLKPATAFMMGKLKISGDMQKAMKLEKLMASLKAKA